MAAGVVQILDRDVVAGRERGAPPEPRRQGDLSIALLDQRVADEIVPGAVEIAAPVEEALGLADDALEIVSIGRPHLVDLRRHFGIGRDHVGKDRDQPVAHVLEAAVGDVEIEATDELAVRARGDQHRLADHERLGQRVMGMAGEDNIDPLHPACQPAIDVETVVREQDDEISFCRTGFRDVLCDLLVADAERPFRDQPGRVGDRSIGKGLADDGNLGAPPFDHLPGLEGRLVPLVVEDVRAEERKGQRVDRLLHAVGAVCEFPVPRHGIGP